MRVAVFIEPWINQRAGISVFTEQLVQAFNASKHTCITLGSKKMDDSKEHIFIPSWRLSFLNVFRYTRTFPIDLARHGIDVLIDPSHFGTLGLFKGCRRFVVVHDITPLLFPEFHPRQRVWAHQRLMKKSLQQCDKIITVSEQTKRDVAAYFGYAEKLVRIYPGVRDLMLNETAADEIPSDVPFILVVGTIEPRKNHRAIIEAFDLLCEENQDVQLYIVGDRGWNVNIDELIASSAHRHRIVYFGYVQRSRLLEFYLKARLCVYVSLYEGFGFPLAEAMKLGCAVVTSDMGSMKEIAGDAAVLVNPESPEEIMRAMLTLVNSQDLREDLIAKSKERAQAFTWERYIQALDLLVDTD